MYIGMLCHWGWIMQCMHLADSCRIYTRFKVTGPDMHVVCLGSKDGSQECFISAMHIQSTYVADITSCCMHILKKSACRVMSTHACSIQACVSGDRYACRMAMRHKTVWNPVAGMFRCQPTSCSVHLQRCRIHAQSHPGLGKQPVFLP